MCIPKYCWSGRPKRLPKTMKAIDIAISFLPELKDKALLLKTPHAWVTGRGGSELESSWKLPPCSRLALIAGCWGRKQLHPAVNSVTVLKGLASIADWCNWGRSAVDVTNHSLIGFEASSMGEWRGWQPSTIKLVKS